MTKTQKQELIMNLMICVTIIVVVAICAWTESDYRYDWCLAHAADMDIVRACK